MNGGDRIAEVLATQGIPALFTLCGGHISPVLAGAKQRGLRVVDVRDEATAVFAADALARLTGVPGVAAVTAGPGVTNTITAIKNAQLAQSPVVILGGAAPTVLRGKGALQDIDQLALTAPHVKRTFPLRRARDLAPAMRRALAAAVEGVPGPVFVECPVDLLYSEETVREWYRAGSGGRSLAARLQSRYLHWHLRRLFAGADLADIRPFAWPPAPAAPAPALSRVAAALARAERPVLVVGSQALLQAECAGEIAGAVERLGAPVYLSGMARGLLGPDHSLHLRHNRRQALKEADLVLLAGVPCDFRLNYGRGIPRGARLVSMNRSATDLRKNRKPDIGVLADAGGALVSLAGMLEGRPDWRPWLARLREREKAREAEIDEQATAGGEYVNPLRLFRELDRAIGDDAVMVADGGDFVATASYTLRPRGPLSWLDPGAFGTLGVGAGFALGASVARPNSEIWAIFGDGALGFSLAEFDTFVRHGFPVIAVVGNDGGWTQIAREQVKILGDDVGTVLARSDYHLAAQALGGEGLLLDSNERIGEVLRQARDIAANGRPVLVNALLARSDFREGSISM